LFLEIKQFLDLLDYKSMFCYAKRQIRDVAPGSKSLCDGLKRFEARREGIFPGVLPEQ
jgi:hypothetical protein